MSLSSIRKKQQLFRRLVKASLFCVYLMLLAGALVRMMGPGIGCPNWPTCFDSYVPPIHVGQLPDDHKQRYEQIRTEKNKKLAEMIRPLGLHAQADRLVQEHMTAADIPFSWQRIWIEYVYRLSGILLGLLIILAFATSLIYWNKLPSIPLLLSGLIAVTGLKVWLASVAVSTDLIPGLLTVHLFLAFLIITGLMYLYVKTAPGIRALSTFNLSNTMRYALGTLIISTLIQVLSGTQVRQQIDVLAAAPEQEIRGVWLATLNWTFTFHWSFSLLLLIGNAWLCYQIFRYLHHYHAVFRAAIYLAIFLGIIIITGVAMAYFALPQWSHPIHLFCSSLLFGVQIYLYSALGRKTQISSLSMHLK